MSNRFSFSRLDKDGFKTGQTCCNQGLKSMWPSNSLLVPTAKLDKHTLKTIRWLRIDWALRFCGQWISWLGPRQKAEQNPGHSEDKKCTWEKGLNHLEKGGFGASVSWCLT